MNENNDIIAILKKAGSPAWAVTAIRGAIAEKAKWSRAYINDLPDSAFLFIEPGGKKDADGKTTPRSLRHFPYQDADGSIDLPHLRNAISRAPQSDLPKSTRDRVAARARRLLSRVNKAAADVVTEFCNYDLGHHDHAVLFAMEEATIAKGGAHEHVFLIDGELVRTRFDGEHDHGDGAHVHEIYVRGQRLLTESSAHGHEIGLTASGGLHTHALKIQESEYVSLSADKLASRAAVLSGPFGARIVFVTSRQSALEKARGGALASDAGRALAERYLPALGLERADVVITEPGGVGDGDFVIALGKEAASQLADPPALTLTHPAAVARNPSRASTTLGLARKLAQAKKAIDAWRKVEPPASDIRILKAAVAPKRIVYGVVLSPYGFDAGGSNYEKQADGTWKPVEDRLLDWVPPAVIEKAAHDWMKIRTVDYKHAEPSESEVVESFIEPYPSPADYAAAMKGDPHSATVRPFGSDVVRSGEWVIGVRLTEAEWSEYEKGALGAYSMVGLVLAESADDSDLPKVDFIEYGPK